MPDSFEFYNEPHFIRGPSNVPDRVSQDLQQRTFIAISAVVAGIAAGALCLVIGGPKGELVWLGFAVLALILLFLLVRYFEIGIVGFLGVCWIAVGTPAIAQAQSGGGAQQLKVSQAGLAVLLIIWAVRRLFQIRRGEDNRLYQAPVNVIVFIYLAISIWSTANSMLFPNELVLAHGPKQFIQVNLMEILMRVLALGGLIMVGNALHGRALKAAAVALIVPGVLTFALQITRLDKIIPSSNYLAFPQIVAMGVVAAVVLTGTWTRLWVRVVCAVVTLSMIFNWFFLGTEWVSGWLGALMALAVIVFTSNRKLFWRGCGGIAIIVLADFSYFYQTVYVSNFYGDHATHDRRRAGHMGTFTNDRTRMWGAAFRYAEEFPLGIGIGNYRPYNMYFGRVDVWNTTAFTSAHGTYSQALSETGFAGFIALAALIYVSSRMMRGYYNALSPGWSKTFVLGAWGGCIGVFCASFNGDYLFPAYYNGGMGSFGASVYTWLAVGLTMAVARERGLNWKTIATTTRAGSASKPARVVAPIYNHGPYAMIAAATENGSGGEAQTS